MYSMMIVEDEEIIRNGLKACLDWPRYSCRIDAEAEDGEQALELAKRLKPDIVLTDVVMGGMDGLEFLARLRQELAGKPIQVVVISAHEKLDYVKAALKHGAADYLLKPFDMEELRQVITRVVRRCEEERRKRLRLEETERRLDESTRLFRERLLLDLCYGSSISVRIMEKQLRLAGLDDWKQGAFGVYSFHPLYNGDEQVSLRFEAVMKAIAAPVRFVKTDDGDYAGVVHGVACGDDANGASVKRSVRDWAERIVEACSREAEPLTVAVGVGPIARDWTCVHASFTQARLALAQTAEPLPRSMYHVFGLGASLREYRPKAESNSDPGSAPAGKPESGWIVEAATAGGDDRFFRELLRLEDVIWRAMETEDETGTETACAGWIALLGQSGMLGLPYCRVLGGQLAMKAALRLAAPGGGGRIGSPALSRALADIRTSIDLPALGRALSSAFRACIEAFRQERLAKPGKIVRDVLEAIEARYGTELTIQALADDVYMSPNHLSHLFKKETGETINETITRVRLRHAAELLRRSALPVRHIAEAVGYKDTHYFAKLFKRTVGLTPKAYRNR